MSVSGPNQKCMCVFLSSEHGDANTPVSPPSPAELPDYLLWVLRDYALSPAYPQSSKASGRAPEDSFACLNVDVRWTEQCLAASFYSSDPKNESQAASWTLTLQSVILNESGHFELFWGGKQQPLVYCSIIKWKWTVCPIRPLDKYNFLEQCSFWKRTPGKVLHVYLVYSQVHKYWDIDIILIFLALYTTTMDLKWNKQDFQL